MAPIFRPVTTRMPHTVIMPVGSPLRRDLPLVAGRPEGLGDTLVRVQTEQLQDCAAMQQGVPECDEKTCDSGDMEP